MKVLLRANFSQFSGYGRDGIGLALALLDRGHQVRISPIHVDTPLPRELAGLMCLPLDGPFDLALHASQPDITALALTDAAQARCNVLWTMWGFERLPEDEPWVEAFAERTEHFDHIVAYDPDSRDALAEFVNDPERVRVLIGGYTARDWLTDPAADAEQRSPWTAQPSAAPSDPTFTYGLNGRLSVRKGVYTAYRAFQTMLEAHDMPDARLVLRSTAPVFPPGADIHPQVRVEVGKWLPDQLRDFYRSLDCFLAPSWADAKNLPPIEALTCGTPAIISDIPGHRGWATSDTVTFVPTERRPLMPGWDGHYVDPDDLAVAMRAHYTDRETPRRQAALAVRTLPAMLDWTRCLERLGLLIGVAL